MADLTPPHWDNVPTWLTAVLSVVGTIGGWKALGPVARWAGQRLEVMQQQRAAERGDMLQNLTRERDGTREENIQLRQELAEERELRMSFAADVAVLTERLEQLMQRMAEDKRDCQREIRRLNGEIRRLTADINELRRQQGGQSS